MRQLPSSPLFERPDLWAFGWSDSAITRAIQSGRLERVRRGVFSAPMLQRDPVLEAIAAARACSGSFISHRSAVLMRHLPMLGLPPLRPDLTVQPHQTGDTSRALLHRARLRPQDVGEVDGHPVTSIARTIIDYARVASVRAVVVALDFALHEKLVDVDELLDVAAMCKRWPGARAIVPTLVLSDARSESPLESCSRLTMVDEGLPRPELQSTVRAANGRFLGRADFYWDEHGVVGEADGRQKYTTRDVLVAEKLRQERMEQAGLVVVRWSWDDIRRPAEFARRLRTAFDRGTRRDVSGFPRLWSVEAA